MAGEPPIDGFLYASESVTEAHPDKVCDRVSDAVLDACLAQDAEARVACETCAKMGGSGMVMILGEVVTKASVNYEQVIREAVKSLGYDNEDKGLDWRTVNVIVALEEQSPDLAQAIALNKTDEEVGAGDSGIAFGYATDETKEKMPLPHMLATKLCARLDQVRRDGALPLIRPDARAQVVVEYRESAESVLVPSRVHTVVICARHAADAKPEQVEKDIMEHVVKPVLPQDLCDSRTAYHLSQPGGGFGLGGGNDTGFTGRRGVADTYGGFVSAGGGSLSGKDGSRVSRSAAYGARWAARSLVEARLCRRCKVQLSYSPVSTQPVSLHVDSYGTAKAFGKTDKELQDIISRSIDFRPGCLQRDLGLKVPQFQKYSAYGHFGRTDLDLPWEKPKELK